MNASLAQSTVEDSDSRSDAALVKAAQADPAAFAPLYRRHLPVIYRYLRARVPSEDEAADLTQQVFLRALEALPSYQHRGLPFIAWLLRIARNTSIDVSRRQRRMVPLHQIDPARQPADPDQPELTMLRHEGIRHFDDLISIFDEEKRNLLILRFAVGLTTPEIAIIVDKREAAVRKQLSRAIATLKEHHHDR